MARRPTKGPGKQVRLKQLSLLSHFFSSPPSSPPATCVCWGAGWDSSAMLIEMVRRGERPALITFADVGAERSGTYGFLPLLSQYLRDHDFPEPVTCEYLMGGPTEQRYRHAACRAARELGIELSAEQIWRLARLYGNMIANSTLPSQAFGRKGCSVKWKIEAQEPT